MAVASSSLLVVVTSSSCAAISTPPAPAATTSFRSLSRSLRPPLRASLARALWSCVVASIVPAMQSPLASIVSTVVDVDDRSYPIYIGSGLLDDPSVLKRHVHEKRVLVVTNVTVASLYLEKVTWALTHNNPTHSPQSLKQRTN